MMHCIRRAALRLPSPVSDPLRSKTFAVSKFFPSILSRQSSPSPLKIRWNSYDTRGHLKPRQDEEETKNADYAYEVASLMRNSESEYTDIEAGAKGKRGEEAEYAPVSETYSKRLRLLDNTIDPNETIFVGNIFYDVTADDLRNQMEKFGIVEKAVIVFDNRGLSKGFGYVKFDSVEAAKAAVEAMHLRVFEGRPLTVSFARTTLDYRAPRNPPSRTLYIGNISFDLSDRDLNSLFKDISNVIDVRVSVDRRTGQPRGFAHAEFTDVESAEAAFEILSRKSPNGRMLRVDYSLDQKHRSG